MNAHPPFIEEIAAGTWRLRSELGGRNVFQYLIASEDRTQVALVDTGTSVTPREVILPALRHLGVPGEHLRLIVITHPDVDHQGGAAALADACPDAVLACGFYDRAMVGRPEQLISDRYQPYMPEHGLGYPATDQVWMRAHYGGPVEIAATFSGGEELLVGERVLEVHHAPGHSAGHLILFEPSTGLLFSSDAVHSAACPGIDGGPAMCPTYEEVDPYLATIELIRRLAPSEVHSGHWPVSRAAEIEAFLRRSTSFVDQVDRLLLARLAEPATMAALCDEVQREAGPWKTPPGMLMFCVHGHLRRLQRRGDVRAVDPTVSPRRFALH